MRTGRSHVLDPFAGSGTTTLVGEQCGVETIGIEAHPFVSRVAQTKLHWREDPDKFERYAHTLLVRAQAIRPDVDGYAPLIQRCFPPHILARLDTLRRVWASQADGSPVSQLSWLALAAILRECSPAGTATWQYVLPKKEKARIADPYQAFAAKVRLMSCDMSARQQLAVGPQARLYADDARVCAEVPDGWADLIITSPPYVNNYDYADATRLEMTFFQEIQGWGDLQKAVRDHLIPSCTQQVGRLVKHTGELISDPALATIHVELAETCQQLEVERTQHGGKKNYHTMIAAYFGNMAKALKTMRRVTRTGALVCLVIGDSAPYGVHVPVERWLGELALTSGFAAYHFEKARDRNTKWKNRKHRVPLHEGYLWIEG